MNREKSKTVNFDDHPIFSKLDTEFSDNGLKFRDNPTKPIGDDKIFMKLGLYVKKLIQDKGIPLRRKDYRGSYSWLSSNAMEKGGETILKLNHYDENDYFWGIREEWAKANGILDDVLEFCSYRFVVQPKTHIDFIGFPLETSKDLDKIKNIIDLIPNKPNF